MKTPNRFVISVLVADRVGILRDVASALTGQGANIDGVSQTILHGYFTVILTVTMGRACSAEDIRQAMLAHFASNEASIIVRRFDASALRRPCVHGERYVVTLSGVDRKGILKAATVHLADKGVNIEDWYVHFDGPMVTHIGEVTVPSVLDIQQLQSDLQECLREFGMTASMQHENIFRVTNEVGAVQHLLAARHR